MNSWHYEKNGERLGPVSEADISALANNRAIDAQTLVWQQGFADWTPLSQTTLASCLTSASAPPALPGNKINNGVVWTLAFAPLLGLGLQAALAAMFSGDGSDFTDADLGHFWYATVLLNIALSIFDVRQLKKAGIDAGQFNSFAFFVPIYLWMRSKALKQSPAYFWVWIATLVLSAYVN
jgi:uncharacterized protein (DUF1684 family)